MKTTGRELGVPVIERRRRKRIMTLRNFGFFILAVLVIIAGFNIRSEMRDSTGEEYGRLYGREIKKNPEITPEVVAERPVAPVDESVSADPFALDSARREQYLGSPTLEPVPLVDVNTASIAPPPQSGDSVRIVGGPEGVALVQKDTRRPPALGGGFGRRQ